MTEQTLSDKIFMHDQSVEEAVLTKDLKEAVRLLLAVPEQFRKDEVIRNIFGDKLI